MAEKGGYKHFMLKEIFEQPRAVRDTMLGRVGQETGRIFLDEMDIQPAEFARFRQVKIIACGTSWHAGLAGKFMIEKLARIPIEVDYGSEFRYRDPIVTRRHADRGDFAIRRNRRYAGRAARGQAAGIENAGHLQRGRLDDHARSRRHHLHARGAGNRRGVHQSLHLPVERAVHPGDVPGAIQRASRRGHLPHADAGGAANSRQAGDRAGARRGLRSAGERTASRHRFPFPRPRPAFSDRARRRAEAEGDFLHSCRGLPGRRNEARPQRLDRRKAAGGGAGHPRRIERGEPPAV